MLEQLNSRRDAFEYLEEYSAKRAREIEGRRTTKALIKTFVIETARDLSPVRDLQHVLPPDLCLVEELHDEVFRLWDSRTQAVGVIEPLEARYFLLYTIEKFQDIDPWVRRLVKSSMELDHVWIAGPVFDALRQRATFIHPPTRYTKLKFEFYNTFDRPSGDSQSPDDDLFDDEDRVASSVLAEELRTIDRALPEVRKYLPSFTATSLLRLPSQVGSGGHELYHDGKVTNRADSFLDHRQQILSVVGDYDAITRSLEDTVWLSAEHHRFGPTAVEAVGLKGTAVVLQFAKPLKERVFHNFVQWTFVENRGPFRLWGEPRWYGSGKVHIYGLDLHLWQQLTLEITRHQMVLILPEGTCGNTVHRLVTNVQRHLDPAVSVYIGSESYETRIRQQILGPAFHELA